MTDYKYIKINEHVFSNPRTKIWVVSTKSTYIFLGWIKWYAPWRQYCFFPSEQMVFSRGCLRDINDFIEEHKAERVGVD